MDRLPPPHRDGTLFSFPATAEEAPPEKKRRFESFDAAGSHTATGFSSKYLPPALVSEPLGFTAHDPFGPSATGPWKKDSFRALLEDNDLGSPQMDSNFNILGNVPTAGPLFGSGAVNDHSMVPTSSFGNQATNDKSLLQHTSNKSALNSSRPNSVNGNTFGMEYGDTSLVLNTNFLEKGTASQKPLSSPPVETSLSPVKTTSSSVKTGLSSVKTITSTVKTGLSPVKTTSSSVKTGLLSVKTTSSAVKTGLSPVKTTSSSVKTGLLSVKTTSSAVKTGFSPVKTTSSTVKSGLSPVTSSSSPVKYYPPSSNEISLPVKPVSPTPAKSSSSPGKQAANFDEEKPKFDPEVRVKEEQATSSSQATDVTENVKTEGSGAKDESKDSSAEDAGDPFGCLDWQNGIATLPGSNLKFKMTEFGTLEIVSTVETDKGDSIEWSTATDHGKKPFDKDSLPNKSDLMEGPPDSSHVLCCEVCGVYGLEQDFCASGRFCSLSCVGAHTGRRNKGREFIKSVSSMDGKVTKKKKKKGKGKKKTSPSPMDDDDPPYGEPISPKPLKGVKPERGRGKPKVPMAEAKGTSLTAGMVPYNFSKPFTWADYLYSSGSKPVPVNAFKQENPDLDVFTMPSEEFKKNMKLEAMDPKHPSYICVCTIVRVKGTRLRLHFDGWSECYDFWTNADSPFIYPVGWCEKNGQILHPHRGVLPGDFNWDKYLKKEKATAASEHLFKPVPPTKHDFEVGMKLEAIDRKNPDLICVATVTNVIGNRFLVHFDEWDDTYDYWCEESCPYIHPVGWCAEQGGKLNPPNDDEVDTFSWEEYLRTTGTTAAPSHLFKKRTAPAFKPYQKLESVDKRNPSLIRCSTVAEVLDYRVRVHFDGWDDVYDDWFDADSTELHPVGYCERTGHPLEPPLTTADKISSVACPTPGCKGIGHVKGAKYSSHHSTFGCPYSLQNLNRDSCLVDRLSPNSMTEESDWSYASKNKSGGIGGPRRGEIMDGVCPTRGCDGSGHVSGHWRTHQSAAGCPRNEANIIKMSRSTVLQPTKNSAPSPPEEKPKHYPEVSRTVAYSGSSSDKASTASGTRSTRRPSRDSKREKDKFVTDKLFDTAPVPHNPAVQEKAVQHVADVFQPWKAPPMGNGYHGNKHGGNPGNERKKSRERLRMSKWSVEEVVKHITSLGCPDQAKIFAQQQIDGEALLLLNQNDIVHILKIKLGPALKIYKSIPRN